MRTPDKEHRELIEDWVQTNPYKAEAYRDAIIEECARVAESYFGGQNELGKAIATDIRALKNKP